MRGRSQLRGINVDVSGEVMQGALPARAGPALNDDGAVVGIDGSTKIGSPGKSVSGIGGTPPVPPSPASGVPPTPASDAPPAPPAPPAPVVAGAPLLVPAHAAATAASSAAASSS